VIRRILLPRPAHERQDRCYCAVCGRASPCSEGKASRYARFSYRAVESGKICAHSPPPLRQGRASAAVSTTGHGVGTSTPPSIRNQVLQCQQEYRSPSECSYRRVFSQIGQDGPSSSPALVAGRDWTAGLEELVRSGAGEGSPFASRYG
jgi:hypothetical protein